MFVRKHESIYYDGNVYVAVGTLKMFVHGRVRRYPYIAEATRRRDARAARLILEQKIIARHQAQIKLFQPCTTTRGQARC